jgi:hypothetical protein
LRALFDAQKIRKGGFYHDDRFATLSDVVNHYDGVFKLRLTEQEKNHLIEYLKSDISTAAIELNELREKWLNPPEWTTTRVLEFPGATDGPWSRFVVDPDARGIGAVRYPRVEARDDDCAKKLAKRTLTNLYNERPAWLANAHTKLDHVVAQAYGFPADLLPTNKLSNACSRLISNASWMRNQQPRNSLRVLAPRQATNSYEPTDELALLTHPGY